MGLKELSTCWNIYPKFLKIINLNKNDKILDAGCGEGILSNYLKNFNLYGLDFSEEAVKEAKKKWYKKVVKSEIYKIPFKNKKFDVTICVGVFQYLEHPEKAFKELMRISKKEIILTVSNFNWFKIKMFFSKKWKKSYSKELKLYSNFTNSDFLRKLARKNNLKIEIKYLSNKFSLLRNLFGNYLASEVVGIFRLK